MPNASTLIWEFGEELEEMKCPQCERKLKRSKDKRPTLGKAVNCPECGLPLVNKLQWKQILVIMVWMLILYVLDVLNVGEALEWTFLVGLLGIGVIFTLLDERYGKYRVARSTGWKLAVRQWAEYLIVLLFIITVVPILPHYVVEQYSLRETVQIVSEHTVTSREVKILSPSMRYLSFVDVWSETERYIINYDLVDQQVESVVELVGQPETVLRMGYLNEDEEILYVELEDWSSTPNSYQKISLGYQQMAIDRKSGQILGELKKYEWKSDFDYQHVSIPEQRFSDDGKYRFEHSNNLTQVIEVASGKVIKSFWMDLDSPFWLPQSHQLVFSAQSSLAESILFLDYRANLKVYIWQPRL